MTTTREAIYQRLGQSAMVTAAAEKTSDQFIAWLQKHAAVIFNGVFPRDLYTVSRDIYAHLTSPKFQRKKARPL